MKGWILYKRCASELTSEDHGVNRLCAVAKTAGITLEVYRPEQFQVLVATGPTNTLLIDQKPCTIPDFVIPRMGADTPYSALAILRQLEELGVYLCNDSTAVATVKDKLYMSQKLMSAGLPIPKTLLVKFPMSVDLVERELGFPVVIKTIAGAKGYGVHLCESAASLKDIMELMSTQPCLNGMIVQAFVQSSHGRDLRVFVLGGRVIGCMQRTSTGGFKANYSLGGQVAPYPVTPEIERLALAAAALFHLDIAGIDLLFTAEGFVVCEANSSPGFKGMEQATGVDIAAQIMAYIRQVVGKEKGEHTDVSEPRP